jgi:hypothetical protein
MLSFLNNLAEIAGHYTTWMLLAAIVAIGLFEWRVKSENKSFIRLSAWGTAAVALLVVAVLTAGSLVVIFCLGVPAMGKLTRPFAVEQIKTVDASIQALEQALAKKDWPAMQEQADRAAKALETLTNAAPALPSLTNHYEPSKLEALRADVKAARENLAELQQAIRSREAGSVEATLQKFRASFKPLQEVAKQATG